MSDYVTLQNDRLDRICATAYGTANNGMVELVLAANPGLADYGPILPLGVTISLPEVPANPTTPKASAIKLWS